MYKIFYGCHLEVEVLSFWLQTEHSSVLAHCEYSIRPEGGTLEDTSFELAQVWTLRQSQGFYPTFFVSLFPGNSCLGRATMGIRLVLSS